MVIIRKLKCEIPYIIRVFTRFPVAFRSVETGIALMFVYGLFRLVTEITVFPSCEDKIITT